MSSPMFDLSYIKNSNEEINSSITDLDTLFSQITNDASKLMPAGSTGTSQTVQDVHTNLTKDRLEKITGIKSNLTTQMSLINNFYNNGLKSMQQIQDQQKKASDIITSQTEINDKRVDSIKTEQNNKMRLVEINSYYSKKYKAQSEIMKIIILVSVISLILWIVDSKQLLPIPSFVFTILISLSVTIGLVVIFYKCYYLILRNNVDYDQIDFDIPLDKLPAINTDPNRKLRGPTGGIGSSSSSDGCKNDECCPPGFAYNNELNFCTIRG
jgi:hypothetical protein